MFCFLNLDPSCLHYISRTILLLLSQSLISGSNFASGSFLFHYKFLTSHKEISLILAPYRPSALMHNCREQNLFPELYHALSLLYFWTSARCDSSPVLHSRSPYLLHLQSCHLFPFDIIYFITRLWLSLGTTHPSYFSAVLMLFSDQMPESR